MRGHIEKLMEDEELRGMEAIKSVKFRYHGDLRELFGDFREMVEFCIDKALELRITSYYKLRKAVYEEWKQRWYSKYHTHYCHSACKIATAILKNFRKRKKRGLTSKERPEVKGDFVKLDEMLFKFEGDSIRISTAPGKCIMIYLVSGEYQKKFVEAWKMGELDVGEVIIKRDYIVVPFKKNVRLKEASATMTIDINEKNITYSVFNENGEVVKTVRLDIYKVKRIHDEHSKKREKIQRKLAKKPLKMRRILRKYYGREKRRAEDFLHKISTIVVREAVKYNAKIVMEDLRNIRRSVKGKSRNLRRRLNRWNFRKLQFFIEYKAKWSGLPVKYSEASYTSSLCPICGSGLYPNGRRMLRCEKCGVDFDRDVVATMNLYKAGCGEPRSPRTLPDEVRLIRPDGTGELHEMVEHHKNYNKERTEHILIRGEQLRYTCSRGPVKA